jgi:L-asparaginase II
MLALCRARGWRSEGYRHEAHRVQRAMAAAHAEAAGVDEDSMPTAVDGCGVVTFGLSLERTARAFSRVRELPGGERIAAAMEAHPELIGGAGQADTELMRAVPGWIAKGGAEGLMCAAGPDGLGVALKIEDGSNRAIRPALHAFLGRLGLKLPDGFARVAVRNAHGEDVGGVMSVL